MRCPLVATHHGRWRRLALLMTLACCPAVGAISSQPFRLAGPLSSAGCHDIALTAVHWSDVGPAEVDGPKMCKWQLGGDWQYVGTEDYFPSRPTTDGIQSNFHYWTHYCRRCQMPPGTILMWFGNSPICYGSCPPGWWQLTTGVKPNTYSSHISPAVLQNVIIDARRTWDGFHERIENSEAFGIKCDNGDGKVLCALGGRPASAGCSYTWRGTAPDCRDACEPGETLIAKDHWGDGAQCVSGTYNKMLCERCQTEILDLNSCTAPAWFGTAPVCSGECYVGDRVMARAMKKSDVPADQDPGGFGSRCWSGWKVRCHKCDVNWNAMSSAPPLSDGFKVTPYGSSCTAPKAGRIWAGRPARVLRGVKTYAGCCRECHDSTECARFHVGPHGCHMFPGARGALTYARHAHGYGWFNRGGSWQAGSKRA